MIGLGWLLDLLVGLLLRPLDTVMDELDAGLEALMELWDGWDA
jgi:hypothetical protein